MGWTGGTENCAEGHHGDPLMSHICPLWTEGWDRQVEQHHGMSHVSWGLRDGMDWWDSIMGCPICPLELRDGMDISYVKGQTLTMGHPLMSHSSVRDQ